MGLGSGRKDKENNKTFSEIMPNVEESDTSNNDPNYITPMTKTVSIKFDYETHKRLVIAKANSGMHIKDYIDMAVKSQLAKDNF